MKKGNYYPAAQNDQIVWLTNFGGKLPGLAGILKLTPAQVAAAVADCGWLVYLLQFWLPATRNWSQTGTAAVAEAQTGAGSALMVLPVYVVPPLPTGIVPVNTGALTRIFALVQTIKNSGLCSDTNAGILGIVGSEQTGPDWATLQPVFTASIVGGQVVIKWNWGGYAAFLDAIEFQVDRNDGKGSVLLTIDTTPGYTDTQPFPTAKTVWTYRAIYQVNDARVGVWSQSVSVAVQA
jgi:hypothetical protein